MTAFLERLRELSEAIEENRTQKRTLPTLVLLFTAIDSLGALESDQATRDSFVSWVEEFMLASAADDWTALDLYAARCGILHTYTAESHLASAGRARRILYAWGKADVNQLKLAAARVSGDWVCIHLDDLTVRFHRAVTRVLDLMEAGDERSQRLHLGAKRWYANVSMEDVEAAITPRRPPPDA